MKNILSLTILLISTNIILAAEEEGSGLNSVEPIIYCLPSSDEAGTGISSVEDTGSGVSTSDETENTITCVLIN